MKRYVLLLIAISLQGIFSQQCGQDIKFASYYADNMVLQRAPVNANIWGYAAQVGDEVTVSITVDGVEYINSTLATQGTEGAPVWSVAIVAVGPGGPYNITMISRDCELSIQNVLFGDVWFCSGQSNMVHLMSNIDDPEEDLADVVNYPDVRVFKVANRVTNVTQEDLLGIQQQWAVPTEDIIFSYSAVCWMYGVHLYNKYGNPVGLVQSAWGGTRIEAWSSPEALEVCFPDGTEDREDQNAASALYNGMVHPLFPLAIRGALWYQGEANTYNYESYGCAIQQMVTDWRARWYQNTPTMSPEFPFGQVQLAPNNLNDNNRGFPNVRWHQTYEYGYSPNDLLQGMFIAIAMDAPDFDSPHGSIHPRYKRQVAERLFLAGLAVAYNDESEGTWQGPLPTDISIVDGNLVISLDNEDVEARDTDTTVHYEVCCATDSSLACEGEGDGTNTRWELTQFMSLTSGIVTVTMPCDLDTEFAVGVRYAWRESPCPVLEACAIHTVENGLPAPPFIQHGLIARK